MFLNIYTVYTLSLQSYEQSLDVGSLQPRWVGSHTDRPVRLLETKGSEVKVFEDFRSEEQQELYGRVIRYCIA